MEEAKQEKVSEAVTGSDTIDENKDNEKGKIKEDIKIKERKVAKVKCELKKAYQKCARSEEKDRFLRIVLKQNLGRAGGHHGKTKNEEILKENVKVGSKARREKARLRKELENLIGKKSRQLKTYVKKLREDMSKEKAGIRKKNEKKVAELKRETEEKTRKQKVKSKEGKNQIKNDNAHVLTNKNITGDDIEILLKSGEPAFFSTLMTEDDIVTLEE